MAWKWLEKKCYPDHPTCGTAEQWSAWSKIEKSKPVCNFCVNTVPLWFARKGRQINDIKYWFLYRFSNKHKYQLIDTGLKPNYHEIDTRMLHGMFNMLKNFCEDEQPMHDWCWQEAGKEIDAEKDGKPYKRRKFVKGKEAALESFAWQKKLVYNEDEIWRDEDKHLIGTPTPQAKSAEEIEKLYLWWVETRPARVDPYEAFPDPFLEKRLEQRKAGDSVMSLFCKGTEEEEAAKRDRYMKIDELEKQYDEEDTEMLIRLIKIRKSLWT